ncbi:ATP-binding protein [Streptomyces sp. NPDC048650]|uniref:ATP-binding protein n=1 Tax=Streptomyces sp. NPDC048650 TaxID=3365583 RepID=UPI003723202E
MGADATGNAVTGGVFFHAVVQGRNITVQLPAPVTPALCGLPVPSATFTGRDGELRTVLELLDPAGSAPAVPVSAVSGLAGVGKTELAVHVADAARDRGWFPGGVLFEDFHGFDDARRVEPGTALGRLLRALGVPDEHIPADVSERTRLYASVLSAFAGQGRRVLVVLDNVSSAEQVRPLLPRDSATGVVITSRHTLGELEARLIELPVLGAEAAVAMLGGRLRAARGPADRRVGDHPRDALRITELCGRLPLAVQIAAALLADDPARPLAALADDLEGARTRLDEMSYHTLAVRAAFDLSYARLERLEPAQTRLFRLITLNPGPEVSTGAAAVLAGQDVRTTRRQLEALARAHLIERGGAYGRWRMHDLVRLHTEEQQHKRAEADGGPAAHTRLLEHYLATALAAAGRMDPVGCSARHGSAPLDGEFRDRTEALSWLDAEFPNLMGAVTGAGEAHASLAMRLTAAVSGFLELRRHTDEWVTLAECAVRAAEHLADRAATAHLLTQLGRALQLSRRFEGAVGAHRRATAAFRAHGDRHGEGTALLNLGGPLHDMHRYAEAMNAYRTAGDIFQEFGNWYGVSRALINLGSTLQELARFEEAIDTCRTAVALCRELGDSQGEGFALGNLGVALRGAHRHDEAVVACRDAARICHERDDRHGEAKAQNIVVLSLERLGRHEEALAAGLAARATFRDLRDRHGEGHALSAVGTALRALGRPEEAVDAQRTAVALLHGIGDAHGEGKALTNLAATLLECRRYGPALDHCREAETLLRRVGDRHSEATAMVVRGAALHGAGRFTDAAAVQQRAAEIFCGISDRHSQSVALANFRDSRHAARHGARPDGP